MGRSKTLEDKEIIRLIDEYYIEHGEKGYMLKIPEIGEYIRKNGYPDYPDYTLRRCKAARKHIEKLKDDDEDVLLTMVTYKTIDVAEFLKEHNTKEKLGKAISALNDYYKKVSESATIIFNKFHELEEDNLRMSQELKNSTDELESLREKVSKLRTEKVELEKERNAYKKALDKYVYPEIANKVLNDAGIAKLDSKNIKEEIDVIEPDSKLPITGKMMRLFEE